METEKKEKREKELFFPYYVNQGRLLDLYAILNGGYSEYSEVTTGESEKKTKAGKADISANGGFRIFNFGATVEGNVASDKNAGNEIKERKVQTVTSVLSIVKSQLEERRYVRSILESQPGDFICESVNLSINSIKHLLNELMEVMNLLKGIQKAGIQIDLSNKDYSSWKALSDSMKELFSGEEVLCEKDKYAVVGNITESNLYQAVRGDLLGTEMKCLAQVKRVFPDGTELMKNSIFTKFKDKDAKSGLIKALEEFSNNDALCFDSVAVSSIYEKPVYQLEIIALYQ